MNRQSLKKHVAFIITIMMFSTIPTLVNAQKKCPDGQCPKGQTCVNGFCVKPGGNGGGGGGYCNCFVRPIPFECGQLCGWVINRSLSISSANSNAISLQLMHAQHVSAKIYDATGRLVKTLANEKMQQGDHQIEWDTKDQIGKAVRAGTYMLKFDTGNGSETIKITVIE